MAPGLFRPYGVRGVEEERSKRHNKEKVSQQEANEKLVAAFATTARGCLTPWKMPASREPLPLVGVTPC
jgi:hypothetical protein